MQLTRVKVRVQAKRAQAIVEILSVSIAYFQLVLSDSDTMVNQDLT